MNKLQTEIEKAIVDHVWRDQIDQTAIAKAAAEVAMQWIVAAFLAGELHEFEKHFGSVPGKHPLLNDWLKENGLTPTEPGKQLSGNTEQLIIGSNGITDPPNEN